MNKKPHTDYKWAIVDSVNLINSDDWNGVEGAKNVYLGIPYLTAIELSQKGIIEFRYLILYKNKLPVAIAVVLLLPFFIKLEVESELHNRIIKSLKSRLKLLSGTPLATCGSPFACGQNGFTFTNEIDQEQAYYMLAQAFKEIAELNPFNQKPDLLLVKECWPMSLPYSKKLCNKGFTNFEIDYNMVVPIHPLWNNFDDYLNSMITKFRTKAKSAYKKSAPLEAMEMTAKDIRRNGKKIVDLYHQVVDKSAFSFGNLDENSFVSLKENLKDAFIVKGYFLQDELIGFSTAFVFNNIMDANYVGLNYAKNQEFGIYSRMLYDFVDSAIKARCTELRLGRTAEEIKSTIGAVPIAMKLYLKHNNHLKNALLSNVLAQMKPSEYEHRQPFKKAFENKLKWTL